MGLKSLDDTYGYRGGQGAYSSEGGMAKLTKGRDDGFKSEHKAPAYGNNVGDLSHLLDDENWRSGPIKQGSSPPRYSPKGYHETHQRGPDDCTGRGFDGYGSGNSVTGYVDGKSPRTQVGGAKAKKPGRAGNQRSGV